MSEKDTMAIRFDRVAEDKSFLPVTRLLAIDIIKNPYLVVGDFMKEISDQDIELGNLDVHIIGQPGVQLEPDLLLDDIEVLS